MPYQPASKALEGLLVLDLTHARAGPICVRQLADWGANVVRIERPGDPADFAGRHEADFQNKHRNKRGMALNLRSDEGRAILYRMVERADVLVENFRPDVKTRLRFDYETLKPRNPRLVYASISAFWQDGPYKDKPGVDQVIQGMSGLMSVTGEPGRGPMRVGIAIADIVTGIHAALGISIALIERENPARGSGYKPRSSNRRCLRWTCKRRAISWTASCRPRLGTSIPRASRPTPTGPGTVT